MLSIEFKANIQNGIIQILDEYKQEFEQQENVKVIVMKQEKFPAKDLIEELLTYPIIVNKFRPFERKKFMTEFLKTPFYFLDSNIWFYALIKAVNIDEKHEKAKHLISKQKV